MNFLLSAVSLWFLLQAGPRNDMPQVKIHGQSIRVEVARSNAEWRKGLMYREKLAPGEGMLFFGSEERPQAFWMKNTLIPLDIIFISKDMKIVSIAKKAVPFSETPIPSEGPAQHVLEVLAGQADGLRLRAGDRVEFVNIR